MVGIKARLGPPLPAATGADDDRGAGAFSNAWWWGADHNLTDLVEMSNSSAGCTDHCAVGQQRGVEVTTAGPLLLLGTNFEHAGSIEYNFTGAQNVVGTVIQTEGSTASLLLNGTSVVVLFGTLFGSATGHGDNHTLRATRGAGPCVAATVQGALPQPQPPALALDLSYRILGAMQKNQALLIVDDDYDVPGNATEWVCAALLKTC